MEHSRARTIWVDVEDLFGDPAAQPSPSGIERLSFGIMRALMAEAGPDRVRFVRRSAGGQPPLYEVPWAMVEAARRGHAGRRPAEPELDSERRGIRRVVHTLPPSLRDPILHVRTLQLSLRAMRGQRGAAEAPHGADSVAALEPGDRFLALGCPWVVPGFADTLATLKHGYRLVSALLVHDLIPVRRPEWVGRDGANRYAGFLDDCLPLADRLLSSSRHTAEDVASYARQRSLRLASPVHPIPVGTSFAAAPPAERAAPPAGLPKPGGYVLVVSTIEPGKNHELAVRIWRALADDVRAGRRDPNAVPELVFAGRVGRSVNDLLQQLESCGWLDGRVRLIRDPSEAELHALYAGCLFTLVPSWFEGFGLPVSDSLAMGKPCVASSATAIPEAGGDLCRYFDPGDLPAAYRAVAALLDEPGALTAWQDRIRREFRPVTWAASAQATLAHLDA